MNTIDFSGLCGDPRHFRNVNRREFMFTGLLGGLGLTMGDYFKLRANDAAPIKATAKSIIHIFLPGGAPHHEMWDPKPFAPSEYRGPYGTVDTTIPGVKFSGHLQHSAKIANKLTVIRSMTHGEADHDRGVHTMFTGYRPSPAIQFPSMGSVISHELGSQKNLPPYVCVPNLPNSFAGTGYLSSAFGPFSLGGDPARKDFAVRDLNLHESVTPERFARRRSMLETVDEHFRSLEKSDSVDAMDSFYQAAYALISSNDAREAFNLKAEPDAVRDKYGRHEAGQRMLMARRLVQAGVRFVSMTYGSWDVHSGMNGTLDNQIPKFDQGFAALITDLEERGMLDETLVMVSSEFGRTPKVNKDGGRDHWPKVFSVVFAGGGFKKGQIYGSSDATGTEPENDPLTIENMAATVFRCIGIDPDKRLMASGNRPIDIVRGGVPVAELLA